MKQAYQLNFKNKLMKNIFQIITIKSYLNFFYIYCLLFKKVKKEKIFFTKNYF